MGTEFEFLAQWIQQSLLAYSASGKSTSYPTLPRLDEWQWPVKNYVKEKQLTLPETILLLVSLAPHIYPDFFDSIIQQGMPQAGDFPRFGGVRGKNFRGFLPTGETALFILGSETSTARSLVQGLFSSEHLFARDSILWLEEVPLGEPAMSGKIIVSPEFVDMFITGTASHPHFNSSFPAKRIQTQLHWNDLVLGEEILQQINELEQWLQHHPTLMKDWGMQGRFKKGYRVLFHGPPGTGKTLTASLLGKYTQREVYKIDLSMVVSKYIGETEKNLEHLFAKAESKNWILFFDEADALFGKRTGVRDAHDKYANQEVSYLLQRIEDFDGLVILASNMKNNIDDAFIRRFNAIIRFPLPSESDRAMIWKKAFPLKIGFHGGTNIPDLVKKYELTGGNINNIVQYSCLKALEKNRQEIFLDDVLNGIKREMHKEGKAFSNNGKSIVS